MGPLSITTAVLTFLGTSIKSCIKLKQFRDNVKEATPTIEALLDDTDIRQSRDLDCGLMDGFLGLGPWKATMPYSSPFFTVPSFLKVLQFGLALFGDIDTNSSLPNTSLLSFGGYSSALSSPAHPMTAIAPS